MSGKIFVIGDTHGHPVEHLSFKKNPCMKALREEDVLIIAGDFGVPFGVKASWFKPEQAAYNLDWLNGQKYSTIVIGGNHDDYDFWESMPVVEKFGGKMRQVIFNGKTYEKIWFVDNETIIDVCGKHVLLIPKAESHDIYKIRAEWGNDLLGTGYRNLFDPTKDDYWKSLKAFKRNSPDMPYRVIGESWWPQEVLDIDACQDFIEEHISEHFDLIVTHDAPASANMLLWRGQFEDTMQEKFFEMLRQELDFDVWVHGHYHFDGQWTSMVDKYGRSGSGYDRRMWGVYYNVFDLEKGGFLD